MNMTKKMILAAVVLPLTLGTASAFAYGGKGKFNHHGMCGMQNERAMARQLNLTPEQQNQLRNMRGQNRQAMQENRFGLSDEVRTLRAQERALMLAPDFDQAAANELATQMVNSQVERRVKMMENRHKMMNILTDEQKANLQAIQQECMDQNWQQGQGLRGNNNNPRGYNDGFRGQGRY